jgi:hypothetical protein
LLYPKQAISQLGKLGSPYPISIGEFNLFFFGGQEKISESQFSELIALHERELLEKAGFGGGAIKQEDNCNLLEAIDEEEAKEERYDKYGGQDQVATLKKFNLSTDIGNLQSSEFL